MPQGTVVAGEKLPAEQAWQLVPPVSAEYRPAAQGAHTVWLWRAWKRPTAQLEHRLAPAAENLPAAQAEQLAVGGAAENRPASQLAQTMEPAAAAVPSAQPKHAVAPALSW